MPNVKVLFWFDVEDYITELSDDALLGLLQVLDERNIPGIFKFVGEKIRVVRDRGRTDILERLARHEIGYHTDMHSEHPTAAEYLEEHGMRDGAQVFASREHRGLDDLEQITGSHPVCYGQPGGSWAPQVFPVMRAWNIPVNLDWHHQISINGRPFWYGGLLNFMDLPATLRMELTPTGLDEAKARFQASYEAQADESVGWISMFYHPTEFATYEFWDGVNFSRGVNTPREEWKSPRMRTREEMNHYLARLGEFLDFTLSLEGVEYVRVRDVLQMVKDDAAEMQDHPVRGAEVVDLAARVQGKLHFESCGRLTFSPSELLVLFKQYLCGEELRPEMAYGPEVEVASEPPAAAALADYKRSLRETAWPHILDYSQLPDAFSVAGGRVNPVDMACTLAAAIANGIREDDAPVPFVRGELSTAKYSKTNDDWGNGWVIFPQTLRVPNIISMAARQTWTLKPARFA